MIKKKKLPDVTLLAVSSIEIDHTQDSLKISSYEIEFASIKFLTSKIPKTTFPEIEYIKIPEIVSINGYNKIIIDDLYKYFDTSHCLIVQSDSFVVNPIEWTDEFLKYDYIGAPWTKTINPKQDLHIDLKKNRVGNGGFSLRSKKLALATKDINYSKLNFPSLTEDVVTCHYLYEDLIKKGISFASIELASKFSVEHIETNKEFGVGPENVFGFHGKHLRRYFKDKFNKKKLLNDLK